jgi:5,10-methylenetetrahydrofolate reductase
LNHQKIGQHIDAINGGRTINYKSHLHRILSENHFAITSEIGPPKSADASVISKKADILFSFTDACNITDNQTAVVRLSSLAGSLLVKQKNIEPIFQISCRDRNRIALQSDILGALALGIHNILFVTGDHQSVGNHPQSKGVFDLDSIQLISIAKMMRDNGIFQNGEPLKQSFSDLFIGGVCNPFATPYDFRIDRLEKKINAGVDFIQTQSVFDLEHFQRFMDKVRQRNLHHRTFILAGVTPIKSEKMLERMKFHIPGVQIPDDMYYQLKNAQDFQKESLAMTCDIIHELKKIDGIRGIHITALFWESIIPLLMEKCNLLPRPYKEIGCI